MQAKPHDAEFSTTSFTITDKTRAAWGRCSPTRAWKGRPASPTGWKQRGDNPDWRRLVASPAGAGRRSRLLPHERRRRLGGRRGIDHHQHHHCTPRFCRRTTHAKGDHSTGHKVARWSRCTKAPLTSNPRRCAVFIGFLLSTLP